MFLTGHTGFKGSWLSLWLQAMGAEVTGYALPPPSQPSLFELANVAEGMTSIMGDIRDLEALHSAFRASRPDVVIHMAAQPLVRYSYENPVETYATNVIGTVNLLEAVRVFGFARAVVNVTTDKCYENREWEWGYRENEPMGGVDPYSSSKGCSELVTAAYRNSFFQSATTNESSVPDVFLASARAGNVIGGGDWAKDRLIPDILAAFERGDPVQIRNPNAIRPWQHVLEPLRGYLMLAEALFNRGTPFAEGWNFGPADEDARPVGWIVEKMAAQFGSGARWSIDKGNHPHEATYLKLDTSKAQNRLGWKPKLPLDRALRLIVEWSTQRVRGADVRALTLKQIQDYQLLD